MRKRFRLLAAVATVGALALAVPGQSQADTPTITCSNGQEPIIFAHTHNNPLLYSNIRLLCIS